MRRARLQRFAVAHHRFNGIRDISAREFLRVRFFPGDHGNRSVRNRKIRVGIQHLNRLRFRFFARGVRGVTFLPVKLQRAQKQFRT